MVIGIQWDDAFRLGLAPLDEQHERIFRLVEDVDHLLDAAARPDAVMTALARLRDMLVDHFRYEDHLMSSVADRLCETAFDAHRACHDTVLGKIDHIVAAFGAEPTDELFRNFGSILFRSVVLDDGEMVSALIRSDKVRPSLRRSTDRG